MFRRSPLIGIILLAVMIPGARADDPPWVDPLASDWEAVSPAPTGGGNGPPPLQVNAWVAVKPGVKLSVKLDDGKPVIDASPVPTRYRITCISKDSPPRYQLSGDVSGWAKQSDLLSPDGELAAFLDLIRKSPCKPELYMMHGVVEIGNQGFGQAIEDFDEALRLNPGYAIAYYQRAKANFLTKPQQLERALGDLYEAIRLEPGNSCMYLGRAVVASDMKLRLRAIEDYTTVLRLDPKNVQAKMGLDKLAEPATPHPPQSTQPTPPSALQIAVDQAAIEEANAQAAAARAKIEDLRAQIEESRARAEKAMLDAERYRHQRNPTTGAPAEKVLAPPPDPGKVSPAGGTGDKSGEKSSAKDADKSKKSQ